MTGDDDTFYSGDDVEAVSVTLYLKNGETKTIKISRELDLWYQVTGGDLVSVEIGGWVEQKQGKSV